MSNQADLKSALGSFVTGVTIVTAIGPDGERLGITANSFNSVSLDPALVLVSISRHLRSFEAFARADCFAINILAGQHQDLCLRFAKPGTDKWQGVDSQPGVLGLPLIRGSAAHFECKTWARYDGGDHLILVGQIHDFGHSSHEMPLVYYRGQFPRLAPSLMGAQHA